MLPFHSFDNYILTTIELLLFHYQFLHVISYAVGLQVVQITHIVNREKTSSENIFTC